MTNNLKCKVIIECNFDRYLGDDNIARKTLTKEIEPKYLQLIEDIIYRLELMGKFGK